jgi:hypothetical protein
MDIEGKTGSYQELDVQALAIAVFKDEKADDGFLKDLDALTGGVIMSVIDSEELKGKEAETVFLHLVGNKEIKAQRLLLVGVGEPLRTPREWQEQRSARCAAKTQSPSPSFPGSREMRRRSRR